MKEKGFTLIELLVVVAIIGILAAIAIPQFEQYRIRAYNADSMSATRNFITAQEAFYVDNDDYSNCTTTAGCVTALPGFEADATKLNVVAGNQLRWGLQSDPYFEVYVCHYSGDMRHAIDISGGGVISATLVGVGACAGFS